MKKHIFFLQVVIVSMVLATWGCSKHCENHSSTEPSASQTAAAASFKTEYNNAVTHNDSCIIWHNHLDSCIHHTMMGGCSGGMTGCGMMDTTHCHAMLNHFDNLFHHSDSLCTNYYNQCQSCGSGSMMSGGGMMGNNQMNCSINGTDFGTAIQNLRTNHKLYCPKK